MTVLQLVTRSSHCCFVYWACSRETHWLDVLCCCQVHWMNMESVMETFCCCRGYRENVDNQWQDASFHRPLHLSPLLVILIVCHYHQRSEMASYKFWLENDVSTISEHIFGDLRSFEIRFESVVWLDSKGFGRFENFQSNRPCLLLCSS